MLSITQMKKRLDMARFTHLAIMFMVAMSIYLFSTIPHKFWVLLTVLVVSAGIEPGLVARRAIHRIGGTFLALALLVPLLYCMQLNYRLVPIIFVCSMIGLVVSSLNTQRYDITVFFTTIMVFLLLAQTVDIDSPEGPFDMILNRGICTIIGVSIVLLGDYLLFQGYRYSHKLYLFHQRTIYNFFREAINKIINTEPEDINSFLFVEKLREQILNNCAPITLSAENLMYEKKIKDQTKENIVQFQSTIWKLQRLLFAMAASKFILKTQETTERQINQYKELMNDARAHFISV